MPRKKSYQREDALEKAKAAFWQYGYQSLGIRAIEEMTGIGRFAIRTDFGGKEGLFCEVLGCYTDDLAEFVLTPLGESMTLAALVDMLNAMVTPVEGSLRAFGCLMTNTVIENASLQGEAITECTERHFTLFRQTISALLEKQQGAGNVKPSVNIADATEFIVGTVVAINVMNRQAGDMQAGRGYVNMAIQTVESWAA